MKTVVSIVLVACFFALITACGQAETQGIFVENNPDEADVQEEADVQDEADIQEDSASNDVDEVIENDLPLSPFGLHGYYAVNFIEHMNAYFYRRPPFTYRELETALWIADTLMEIGFDYDDIEIQSFHFDDVADRSFWSKELLLMFELFGDREPRYYSQNVVLTIPGRSEQRIVLGAHYDTVHDVVGASDNASGVALLLENAMRMRYVDNYYTLVYVFFGAEEIGLLGAYHYLDTLSQYEREQIHFMFNADALFDGPYLVYLAGVYYDGRRTDSDLTLSWSALAREKYYSHGIELFTYHPGMYKWNTDHIVFFIAEIPVLYVAGLVREGDDSFGARVMHSERDCADYINYAWPGKIEQNMWAFSLFLENVLIQK
ncbi:MAG: M28 family metallopeptidase [Defluviitaleaceae bacterium]|nr:M28 family metallopeptidase [Defluviitaleaceae bacterium]